MSRQSNERSFRSLVPLAQMREMMAQRTVVQLQIELEEIDAGIFVLRGRSFDIQSVSDAMAEEKWARWQNEELARMQSRKAQAVVALDNARKGLSRMTAESEVIGKLADDGKRSQARRRQSRATHIS